MKLTLWLSVFLLVGFAEPRGAGALTAKCGVTKDSAFSTLPKDSYLRLHYEMTGPGEGVVTGMEYFHGEPRPETLLGHLIRGGVAVSYCAPDDRRFFEVTKTFEFYADCAGKTPLWKLLWQGRLSRSRSGSIEINALEDNRGATRRKLAVARCE